MELSKLFILVFLLLGVEKGFAQSPQLDVKIPQHLKTRCALNIADMGNEVGFVSSCSMQNIEVTIYDENGLLIYEENMAQAEAGVVSLIDYDFSSISFCTITVTCGNQKTTYEKSSI